MEDECGELSTCGSLLLLALSHLPTHESLLIKAIKHAERCEQWDVARGVLASVKHVPVERVWRTVMEGGMMEARAGRIVTARRVFKVSRCNPCVLHAGLGRCMYTSRGCCDVEPELPVHVLPLHSISPLMCHGTVPSTPNGLRSRPPYITTLAQHTSSNKD